MAIATQVKLPIPDSNSAISLSHTAELSHFGPVSKHLSAYRPHPETDAEWVRLARAAGTQLPYTATKLTTGGMEYWLRKAGVKVSAFNRWGGYKTLADFRRLNPGWSLRSFAGLVLEHRDQMI